MKYRHNKPKIFKINALFVVKAEEISSGLQKCLSATSKNCWELAREL